MDIKIRQRIIGITVLVIILIILAPLLFSGSKQPTEERTLVVNAPPPPPEPTIQQVTPAKPAATISKAPVTTAVHPIEAIHKHAVKSVTTASNAAIKLDHKLSKVKSTLTTKSISTNNNWAVQLASFQNKTNANKLTNKLITKGFAAHVKQHGIIYRVFVGHKLTKQKANQLVDRIHNKINLKGIAIRY